MMREYSQKNGPKSIIVPIYKKGDANIPDNYRGIALTSVLSKVYTHILKKRLTGWAEQEEKILEQQAGFRAGYSTIDHILYTLWTCAKTFTKAYEVLRRICGFKKKSF